MTFFLSEISSEICSRSQVLYHNNILIRADYAEVDEDFLTVQLTAVSHMHREAGKGSTQIFEHAHTHTQLHFVEYVCKIHPKKINIHLHIPLTKV